MRFEMKKLLILLISSMIAPFPLAIFATSPIEIGEVFSVARGEVVITGPGISKASVGRVLVIKTRNGEVKAMVQQVFHTKLKVSIEVAHGIEKGNPVFLELSHADPVTIPAEPDYYHGQNFAINNGPDLRFFPEKLRYQNDKRKTKYPLIVHGENKEDRGKVGLDLDGDYKAYQRHYHDAIYVKGSDFTFEPITAESRAKWGHMGTFECDVNSNLLNCETCVGKNCESKKKRNFRIRKDSIFYGHFYTKQDADSSCYMTGYKERNTIRELVHVELFEGGGQLIWHIFSRDGRTVDAAFLAQFNVCM